MSHDWKARVMAQYSADSMGELLNWMRSEGHSLTRTAELMGVSYYTAKAEADRHGVVFKRYRMPRGRVGFKNHTNTRYFTVHGERMSMGEMARRSGLKRTTIKHRIDVLGWDAEKACTTPLYEGRA